jgi:hypothetical protein
MADKGQQDCRDPLTPKPVNVWFVISEIVLAILFCVGIYYYFVK